MPTSLLLGVDGGGTKTVAWLARRHDHDPPEVVGQGTAGGCNPRAVGIDAACRALATAIETARQDAALTGQPIDVALFAVAGAAQADVADGLAARARDTQLATRVRVVSDVTPLLAAGTPEGWGVALIAGTGSVAHAHAADGSNRMVGGWGYLLGDEGSGFALGRAALQATIRAAEGRGAATDLPAAILHVLQIETVHDIKQAVYAAPDGRARIAGLAPLVTRAAHDGDVVAGQILDFAADDLAELVSAAARDVLDTESPVPLALAGGVLIHSRQLRDKLLARLAARAIDADPVTTVPEPVAGCLRLAADMIPA